MGTQISEVDLRHLKPANERTQERNAELMNSKIFVELMKQFYDLGWMRGSGGAMACIAVEGLIVSPSALQKERLTTDDLFYYCLKQNRVLHHPRNKKITVSSSCRVFTLIMNQTDSECVIHTHSKAANLFTQFSKSDTFEITNQEYIKAIVDPKSGKSLASRDKLVIPIIDNQPSEDLFWGPIGDVLKIDPQPVAVLVRNHGLFVWGPTWERTKIMTESIEYLLDLAVDMVRNGIPLT